MMVILCVREGRRARGREAGGAGPGGDGEEMEDRMGHMRYGGVGVCLGFICAFAHVCMRLCLCTCRHVPVFHFCVFL